MQTAVPQMLGPPPPQVSPLPVQAPPQVSWPPHPSGAVPQFQPLASQVVGVQPHTLSGPPPPHMLGASQVPQLMVAPQPFETAPQFLPSSAQVIGMHGPASSMKPDRSGSAVFE